MVGSDFDKVAQLYDRIQGPLSDLISQKLVEFAKLSPGKKVLDIGSGTGSAALQAAGIVGTHGSVIGIDVSGGMLAIARKKATGSGLANIRFVKMGASSLRFPDRSFDAVISNLGIPTYLFRTAISEASRVLKDSGILCFAEYSRQPRAWTALSKAPKKYFVEKAPPALSARRAARKQMAEMTSEFPPSSFMGILRLAGFRVRTSIGSFRMTQAPSAIYLEHLITREQLEYNAMPEESRKRFREEMLQSLEAIRMRSGGILARDVKFWIASKV